VDIVSFSRSKGLYGGVSVDGAVVATRDGLNTAYYGKPVSPADILVRRSASNPHAATLIDMIRKAAEPK
jgi:lipid-binding SYLF domain-containing protein